MPRLTSLTARIADASHRLTRSERVLARFYEEGLPGAALLDLKQVSAATGVSTATVARFSRKLGYEGFRDMCRSLQDELLAGVGRPIDRLEPAPLDAAQVVERRFATARTDLERTIGNLDAENLEAVGALLSDESRPLYLAAIASGRPIMEHFYLLARYLRGGITMLGGQDQWAHALSGLTGDAVVMASAFDRAPSAIEGLLSFAGEHGATRVLITNRMTPLVTRADVLLMIATGQDGVFRSRLPLLVVLESLLDLMTQRCPHAPEHAANIERTFALLHEHLMPPSGSAATGGSDPRG